MDLLERLVAVANDHGFTASIVNGAVVVAIDFYNHVTGEDGVELFTVSSMSGLRKVLGY